VILRSLLGTALAWALFTLRAEAAPLPQTIAAPAPFPLITATFFESEFVAPGVTRGDYRLLTTSGPLHISVVAADLHEPTIRLDAVTAYDRLTSPGETISAMARRTGAVAGINADYFDIGQTNQPLGIVVRNGELIHPPNGRAAISVMRDGTVRFGTYRQNLDGTVDPPLDGVITALGGGPLLIADGRPIVDPNPPAPEETNLPFPVAGIATEADGTMLLIAVDGRLPDESIGLTRPELGALMLGLGARDGMETDSGGSATLVARILGEHNPRVLNTPSDGKERPVADGLFIYSTAPFGPPARLVYRPSVVRALPGVTLTLHGSVTDAAGHPIDALRLPPWTLTTPSRAGESVATKRVDGLVARVPVVVVEHVDALDVAPRRPNPDPGTTVDFSAVGLNDGMIPILLGDRIRWSTTTGRIDDEGHFRAGEHDAIVTASAGGTTERILVRVGRHSAPLQIFDQTAAARWRFTTIPENGPGGLAFDPPCGCMWLRYDFHDRERAAYAATDLILPERAVGLALEVLGDGAGAGLRVTLVDREKRLERVTLARRIDWTGWRRLDAVIPSDLVPPIRIVSIYAVATLGEARSHASGMLGFRGTSLVLAGTP
jgi:exopolysaccharide biosynthesis protein